MLLQLYRKRQQKRRDTVLRVTRGHILGYGPPKTPFTRKSYIFLHGEPFRLYQMLFPPSIVLFLPGENREENLASFALFLQ